LRRKLLTRLLLWWVTQCILKKMSDAENAKSATGAEAESAAEASEPNEPDETLDEGSRARFVRDLIERGEVVPVGEELPAGATHELEDEDGRKILHRRRFSAS
jgi:hypothetical protein